VELPHTPFILALPGFQTEEIEPWDETVKTRRLKVRFRITLQRTAPGRFFTSMAKALICRVDYSAPVAGVHRRRTTCPTTRIFPESSGYAGGGRFAEKRTAPRFQIGFRAIDIASLSFS